MPRIQAWDAIRSSDGICVPGGFGNRGTEGKILACQYARENKKPYLGLCLGMQVSLCVNYGCSSVWCTVMYECVYVVNDEMSLW